MAPKKPTKKSRKPAKPAPAAINGVSRDEFNSEIERLCHRIHTLETEPAPYNPTAALNAIDDRVTRLEKLAKTHAVFIASPGAGARETGDTEPTEAIRGSRVPATLQIKRSTPETGSGVSEDFAPGYRPAVAVAVLYAQTNRGWQWLLRRASVVPGDHRGEWIDGEGCGVRSREILNVANPLNTDRGIDLWKSDFEK